MKLVLVAVHIEKSPRAVPLGVAMISAVLKQKFSNEMKTGIFDFYLEQKIEDCLDQIIKSRATHVGFSMYMWNRQFILSLAKRLKSVDKNIVVFLGGPEATASYDRLIEEDYLDFIVKGEGEVVTENVIKALIQNENMDAILKLAADSQVPKLEDLPSPYLTGTLNPDKYEGLLWELSRGCPFKCDFCFESRGTSGIRRFSIERIEKELDLFIRHNVSQVFVLDPTFNYNPKNAKKILKLIIEKETDIHFYFEVRSEFIDSKMAELFSMINCSLQIGLQSSDPLVLKNINRKLDPKAFKKKILLLHEVQVIYGFDLIYGLPGDDLQGFRMSMDYALSMAPNHLDIFPLSVLPATKLHETAPSFKLKYLQNDPYTVISSPSFSEDDMQKAERLSKACDLFYNQGKAVPWFALITDSLGISPVELIADFADWLDKRDIKDSPVFEIQREFLRDIFVDKTGNKELGSIASDIAAYFGYTAMLVEGGAEVLQTVPKGKYRLNQNSVFVKFDYDPMMLEDAIYSGITNIKKLPKKLRKMKDEVLFYINDYQLDVKVFPEELADLLRSFKNGRNKLPENKKKKSFINSCIRDNIIIQSNY